MIKTYETARSDSLPLLLEETGNSFSPCCGVRTKVGEPGAKPPNGPRLHLTLDMQTAVIY